jgi:hypothetical protein
MSVVTTLIKFIVKKLCIKSLIVAPIVTLTILLTACSPKFDWREVRGTESPFIVLLPAKPASFARDMTLNGISLKMQMTAADVDGVSCAVGSAKVTDASKIPGVLEAMRQGMLNNIHGVPEKNSSSGIDLSSRDVVSYGKLANGQPVKFVGRFLARGAWVYQIVIIGKEKMLTPEVVDTFMTSFKIN